MAYVGLKYAAFAPIKNEVRGQALEYDSGVVVGKMISADISYTRNTNPLYADDAETENDNSIVGGSITIGVDDVSEEAELAMLGMIEEAGEEGSTGKVRREVGDATPYGGFGYVRVKRKGGVTSYRAYWIHKTQLGIASESAATKAESINWQTPTLTGPIMGVVNHADGKNDFRDYEAFATEAEAVAWVNKRANIAAA